MATRVQTSRTKCVGTGNCALLVPTIFDQDDDASVKLVKDDVEDSELAAAQDAVESCPAQAIWLEQSAE
jgi:ferredoxin